MLAFMHRMLRSCPSPHERRRSSSRLAVVACLLTGFTALPLASAAQQDALLGLGIAEAEEEEPQRSIAPTSSPSEDRALEKRLGEIYAQVEGLEEVTVEVHAGVAELSGEVFSDASRDQALKIAHQLQGVAEVQDEIVESRDLERRLRSIVSDLRERVLGIVAAVPLLGVAILIFVTCFVAGRLASKWDTPYRRITRNPFARDVARQVVFAGFALLGLVSALNVLDATAVVATIAGAAGLAGLAVSFAFHDLVENYIASVLLSLRQPFQANDHVIIDEHEGRVVRLTSRATILMTLDGNHLRIPNAQVYKGTILNYTTNPERRFGFEFVVADRQDLAAALSRGIESLEAMTGILAEPPPTGWVERFGEGGVVLLFSAWIDQREADWFKARGEAMRVLEAAFDAAGVARPEMNVNVRRVPIPAERSPGELPASDASSRASPPPAPVEVDISPDTHIEEALAEDRAAGGPDLLDSDLPQE